MAGQKVTIVDVEAQIKSEHYFTGWDGVVGAGGDENSYKQCPESLNLLTFCVLVLQNGFTVVGKSACADPKIFDAIQEIELAREDALEKIWPLLGYQLKERLHQQS